MQYLGALAMLTNVELARLAKGALDRVNRAVAARDRVRIVDDLGKDITDTGFSAEPCPSFSQDADMVEDVVLEVVRHEQSKHTQPAANGNETELLIYLVTGDEKKVSMESRAQRLGMLVNVEALSTFKGKVQSRRSEASFNHPPPLD